MADLNPNLLVRGAATVYRLFDVGYEIDLVMALDLLSSSAPDRVRPVRGEAQALEIPNPPITVLLGPEAIDVGGHRLDTEISARIYEFGVCSMRARVHTPDDMTWEAFAALGAAIASAPAFTVALEHAVRRLVDRINPSISGQQIAPVAEEYVVYRIRRLTDAAGTPLGPDAIASLDVVPLLLGETRPLSEQARKELLPHRFSYYADDLAILTWDNALVVEPGPDDTDIEYVLEFANAQLLELRYYDAELDLELPLVFDRVAEMRGRSIYPRRYAPLLAELQQKVADVTELVERAENSLKVTDDVYLARIYASALDIFRARAWRSGIDRKLAILRDTYEMLNAQSQAARGEALEVAVVVLILVEIVLGLWR